MSTLLDIYGKPLRMDSEDVMVCIDDDESFSIDFGKFKVRGEDVECSRYYIMETAFISRRRGTAYRPTATFVNVPSWIRGTLL